MDKIVIQGVITEHGGVFSIRIDKSHLQQILKDVMNVEVKAEPIDITHMGNYAKYLLKEPTIDQSLSSANVTEPKEPPMHDVAEDDISGGEGEEVLTCSDCVHNNGGCYLHDKICANFKASPVCPHCGTGKNPSAKPGCWQFDCFCYAMDFKKREPKQ